MWFSSTTICSIEDIYDLLVAVLPIFIALAEINHSLLETTENSEALKNFYTQFIAGAFNLHSALHTWGPFETLQKLSILKYEKEARNELSRVLCELETRFLSWNGEKAKVCRSLGLERKDKTYPKLRALRRILSEEDSLDEDSVNALTAIIRIDNKSSSKRNQLLHSLQSASSFLYDLQPYSIENSSSCTIRFTDYPFQHVKGFTTMLFEVLSKNWPCRCPGNSHLSQCPVASHISRKTRLNLTQHQRFEIVPRYGQKFSRSKALFRILFPTGLRHIEWQDTDIIIHDKE